MDRVIHTFLVRIIAVAMIFLFSGIQQANSMEQKFFFGVRWEVNGLPHALDVNGIPRSFAGPADVKQHEPMTQYMRKGINRLDLVSWPPNYTPDQYLALSVVYWEMGENPSADPRTAFRVSYYPAAEDPGPFVEYDATAGHPARPVAPSINFQPGSEYDTLHVDFEVLDEMPTWCWEQGDILTADNATRDDLTQSYRKIHALMAAKDNDTLMDEWWANMIRENAAAYNRPEGYVRNRASFDVFFDNPDAFRLDPLPTSPMTMRLGAENRIAWLVTQGDAGPLRFAHVQQADRVNYVTPYFIRRNGNWEICR